VRSFACRVARLSFDISSFEFSNFDFYFRTTRLYDAVATMMLSSSASGAPSQRDLVSRRGLGRFSTLRLSCRQRLSVEACGIFGIYKRSGSSAVEIYEGLLMLQHRGQDSAGIVSYDGHRFRETKDNGLVKDVFTKEVMKLHEGSVGLGHVRYPTAGSSTAQEAQPFFVNSPLGIYLVRPSSERPSPSAHTSPQIHNGNLTNTEALRTILATQSQLSYQRHLRTDSDSEVLLNIFADEIHRAHKARAQAWQVLFHRAGSLSRHPQDRPMSKPQELVFDAVKTTMQQLKGSYSIISLISHVRLLAVLRHRLTSILQVGLLAFRDPLGIRPLVLGHRVSEDGPEWCFASEDCAFGPLGFTKVRDASAALPGADHSLFRCVMCARARPS